MSVEIDGFDELEDLMDEIAVRMENPERALTKGAIYLTGLIKELAPVRTGNLRDSYNYDVDNKQAIVGSPVEYAPYVEVTRPHVRPAVDNNEDNIVKVIVEDIFSGLE